MKKIDPAIYNKKYFASERCEGYEEYKKNKLSYIKQLEVKLMDLKKGDMVLDAGCGRGDIPAYLSQKGYNFWATDYAKDAVALTRKRILPKYRKQVVLADARKFVVKDVTFNKIITGDVIEHMTYADALKVVNKLYDQLVDGGLLVIHTAPNTWFKNYTYPFTRFIFKLLGQKGIVAKLDENIRATHDYHIDEYSVMDLHDLMKKSKFDTYKVWINRDAVRTKSSNYLDPIKKSFVLRVGIWIINHTPLIYFFGNDLFVLATK